MSIILKSLVTLSALAVLSAVTSASPAPSPEPALPAAAAANNDIPIVARNVESAEEVSAILARQDPNVGCVRMCGDHYFMGSCYTFCTNNNQCANMGGGFNDWVSSLEVVSNRVSWTCTYYEHAGCTGESFTSQYDDTLHDSGGWWADKISSIRCWRLCSPSPACPN